MRDMEFGDPMMEDPAQLEPQPDVDVPDAKAYGGTAAAHRGVQCECGHGTNRHEGDEYGFCLVCDCNHYRPVIRAT